MDDEERGKKVDDGVARCFTRFGGNFLFVDLFLGPRIIIIVVI